ncbi:hypothetical protein GQ55_7G018300, partial [Panicum hallii var. hallii]
DGCNLCSRNFSDVFQNFRAHLRDKKTGRAQEAAANGYAECEHCLGRMPPSSPTAGPSTRISTRRQSTGQSSRASTRLPRQWAYQMSEDNEPLTISSIDTNFTWSRHDMDTLIDLFFSFKIQNGRLPTASERSIISNAAF